MTKTTFLQTKRLFSMKQMALSFLTDRYLELYLIPEFDLMDMFENPNDPTHEEIQLVEDSLLRFGSTKSNEVLDRMWEMIQKCMDESDWT